MKYNIIGDIHGRTIWKDVVISDGINVFVGDYFSPYNKDITWEQQKQNFLDIIQFKKEHPETILLVGNHDEDHWHWHDGGCSRHNFEHENDIRQLFEENKELFLAAYSIGNKYLVTHAGLSIRWMYRCEHKAEDMSSGKSICDFNGSWYWKFKTIEEAEQDYRLEILRYRDGFVFNPHKIGELARFKHRWYEWDGDKWKMLNFTPDECAEYVNRKWLSDPNCFSFSANCNYDDCYGTTPTQSPMWIRVGDDTDEGLHAGNIFSGTEYVQIFGHTIDNVIQNYYDISYDVDKLWYYAKTGHMIMVDCLEKEAKSYIINC